MQTIKTASICVLMMTVLYGAYVSMTTPPEPLPPGVESMIVESGALDLGEDFGEFELDNGVVDDSFVMGSPSSGDFGEDTFLGSPSGLGSPNGQSLEIPAAGASDALVSLDPPQDLNTINQIQADRRQNEPTTFQMSDLESPAAPDTGSSSAVGMMTRLPPVTDEASTPVAVDMGRNYPSTDGQFELPEPEAAMSDSAISLDAPGASPAEVANPSSVVVAGLTNAIETADRQYGQDRKREALATLSLFYETPNLSSTQRDELLSRLDPLARDVIYSPDHLLEEPHRVSGSETLIKIAEQYEVPWQLLANINGIEDPVTVLPGTDLKVVRGPFRADVDLANQELTLFLGDLYAGRFPIGVGSDPSPERGNYTIQEKQSAKTYYDMSGNPVPPGNPRNPYGSMWIDLGGGMSLHGSPQDESPTTEGCVSIAGNYARDVFGILSEGSEVIIR